MKLSEILSERTRLWSPVKLDDLDLWRRMSVDKEAQTARLEEMLNELIDCHYGVATHHIGDGDGIPDKTAEKIRDYWEAHLKGVVL